MTLQDDIQKLKDDFDDDCTASGSYAAYIAAGLERDYYLVKLADLPEVTESRDGWLSCRGMQTVVERSIESHYRGAWIDLAFALHKESHESEAAALEARREELVHQYGYELTYDDQSTMTKDLINRLISANADDTVAAEEAPGR